MSLTISNEDCEQDGLLERKMIATGFWTARKDEHN